MGGTVLVVDDQDVVRDVIRLSLESAGYRVLEAATPSEAIALARDAGAEVDLLVTDVVMPEMDAFELAEPHHVRAAGSARPLHVRLHRRGCRRAVHPEAVHAGAADREGRRRARYAVAASARLFVEQRANRLRQVVAAEGLLQERGVRRDERLLVVAGDEEDVRRVDLAARA